MESEDKKNMVKEKKSTQAHAFNNPYMAKQKIGLSFVCRTVDG